MTAPALHVSATLLDSYTGATPPEPGSWFITHPLGQPAGGTYTEVRLPDEVLTALVHATPLRVDTVLERAVHEVAGQLYGTAYAFTYRPDQYAEAIERFGLRLRERVEITTLEVHP